MSYGKRRPDRLTALERWQSSELEDAKLKMAQLNAAAASKRADVKRIEGDIDSLQSFAREQAADSSGLSPDALLRMNEFQAFQQQQLQHARRSHEQAVAQADDAQGDVLRLFENLSVVQRLLGRRQELASQEQQREAQKLLDEGALSRAPRPHSGIDDAEEISHGS
ncbi:MAG TPA: flagellar FliJ family protein [Steroidobacter sp.]|nr:flagellar FliJ family protein [Steroidobacter sp.]